MVQSSFFTAFLAGASLAAAGPVMHPVRSAQPIFELQNGTVDAIPSGISPSGIRPSGIRSSGIAVGTAAKSGRLPSSTIKPHGTVLGTAAGSGRLPVSTSKPHVTGTSGKGQNGTATHVSTSAATSTGAPIWNLGNNTCDDLVYLNGSQAWAAVQGDKVVAGLTNAFNKNLLVCPECFGMTKEECHSTNSQCTNGLRTIASNNGPIPRFDSAAAIYASDADETDLVCQIQTGECSGAPSCSDCNGPGTFAVLKSFETMSNTLNNVYNALSKAGAQATDQMMGFSSDFAPVPSVKDQTIFMGILTAVVAGLCGAIPGLDGLVGVVAGTMAGVAGGVASDMSLFSQPAPADTAEYLGLIVNSTQQSYVNVASSLFTNGSYAYTNQAGDKSTTIYLADSMKDGALMAEPSDPTQLYDALVPIYERVLFQQLAAYTWQHLEVDSKTHIPYIVFDTMPCDQVQESNKNALPNWWFKGLGGLDNNVTYNGNCYYLMDAVPKYSQTGWSIGLGPENHCEQVHSLPGGTNKLLSSKSAQYADLSLADFIIPSVEGWSKNGKKNGYPSASANGQLVSDPRAAGMTTFPVCDYMGNSNMPGTGCPNWGPKPKNHACQTY